MISTTGKNGGYKVVSNNLKQRRMENATRDNNVKDSAKRGQKKDTNNRVFL